MGEKILIFVSTSESTVFCQLHVTSYLSRIYDKSMWSLSCYANFLVSAALLLHSCDNVIGEGLDSF